MDSEDEEEEELNGLVNMVAGGGCLVCGLKEFGLEVGSGSFRCYA